MRSLPLRNLAALVIAAVVLLSAFACATELSAITSPGDAANARRLPELVHRLTSLQPERSFENPESLDAAAAIIENDFRQSGFEPTRQTFDVKGVSVHNISALIGRPEDRRLIVGAHYDSVAESPGADDNASGVAVLLELARRMQPRQQQLGFAVEFVAFTLEEPPFFRSEQMGSALHVRRLQEQRVSIVGMISIESVGFFSNSPGSQTLPPGFPSQPGLDTGNFLAVVGRPADTGLLEAVVSGSGTAPLLPLLPFVVPRTLEGADFSDHLNYWNAGIPAIMITDTASLRNPNYHTALDLPRDLSFEKMEDLISILEQALHFLD